MPKRARATSTPLVSHAFRLTHARPQWRCRGPAAHLEAYVYTFETHAKQRWFGRAVLDVLKDEFGRGREESYFAWAIEAGVVRLNGDTISPERAFQNHDLLQHTLHRHEPPVASEAIRVVGLVDGLFAVSKPAPLPCHPCGGYHLNSLKALLERRLRRRVFPCHRLDRLTTGIVVLGLDSLRAAKVSAEIRGGACRKVYLARVRGDFQGSLRAADETAGDADDGVGVALANRASYVSEVDDDGERWLSVAAPVYCKSPQLGIWAVAGADGPGAKPAETLVRRKGGDGATTVLEVRPLTGRTHQIRLHCQFLGFPIANDPCYGGDTAFGAGDVAERDVEERVCGVEELVNLGAFAQELAIGDPVEEAEEDDNERLAALAMEKCAACRSAEQETESTSSFGRDHRGARSGGIWLHAWRYSGEGWAFETPAPAWAEAKLSGS